MPPVPRILGRERNAVHYLNERIIANALIEPDCCRKTGKPEISPRPHQHAGCNRPNLTASYLTASYLYLVKLFPHGTKVFPHIPGHFPAPAPQQLWPTLSLHLVF
jgi:hypothetical protein